MNANVNTCKFLTTQTCNYKVRFEVFTLVTIKNTVFWDVAPCKFIVNRRFGGTYRLHLQGRKIRERGTGVTTTCSLADFSTLKIEEIRSPETSVHTRCTRRHIREDGILHALINSNNIYLTFSVIL
jgi:hypothetical protein